VPLSPSQSKPFVQPLHRKSHHDVVRFIDPTLEHDLTSTTQPWALSPLIATMPHFMHERISSSSSASSSRDSLVGLDTDATPTATTFATFKSRPALAPFPPKDSIKDDTSQLHFALVEEISLSELTSSSSSSLSSASSFQSARSSNFLKSKLIERKKRKGTSKKGRMLDFRTASDRRSYFSVPKHLKEVRFGPEVRILAGIPSTA